MVKKDEAPVPTPPPSSGGDNKQTDFDRVMYQRNLFMGMALNMTWQLALVVIVPIVGGYELDQHYNLSPWLTIGGFIVAAIGVFGILSRVVAAAGQKNGYGKPKGKV